MALGCAAYPKTVFQSNSRAASRQANLEASNSIDKQYLSVGVGEDAYFRRPNAIGVADGVGGWSRVKGANPALYSRKLMHYACLELSKADEEGEFEVDPKMVLQKSYDAVCVDVEKEVCFFLVTNHEILVGSATACIAILSDDELRIANLGDGGVVVVRGDEIVFRSEEQQHSFNFPFQLGTGSKDSPSDADLFTVKVEEGDVVVVATDGLFDNVFDDEIVSISSEITNGKKPNMIDPQEIATQLALRCREGTLSS
jgi:serine/threonine protein phosphatase PrpC